MAAGCVRCLKLTMCVANFLCFIAGISLLALGISMTVNFKMAAVTPSLASFKAAHVLMVAGVIISAVSFLGFLGALKENRCLLFTFFLLLFIMMLLELAAACLLLLYDNEIAEWVKKDLRAGLERAKQPNNASILIDWNTVQEKLHCCGVNNSSDWGQKIPRSCCKDLCDSKPQYYKEGCFEKLKVFFEENFLYTGVTVIVLCIIEVLGMCFAMTLFCHLSRSELGYKF